ncbi:hypothetical protein ElyMa_000914100 [Elysia marginata]|uniref:Mutator-like transposase domain-containing protein n=1 Tax=Elysia marginata TaxID=1093978 RepID=A0AAV4HBV2_9GAST|nr:hypothetical protein ElyMa_000914100 [Elysia marginata]
MHHKTFLAIIAVVHDSAVTVADRRMQRAAEVVAALTTERKPGPIEVEYPATTICFDGTWHKRGHSSNNGVDVAIDRKTGLVLDTQILSNYYQGCEVRPKPNDHNNLQWQAGHVCQRNFEGSSNAMKAETPVAIFQRSIDIQICGLVYIVAFCVMEMRNHSRK